MTGGCGRRDACWWMLARRGRLRRPRQLWRRRHDAQARLRWLFDRLRVLGEPGLQLLQRGRQLRPVDPAARAAGEVGVEEALVHLGRGGVEPVRQRALGALAAPAGGELDARAADRLAAPGPYRPPRGAPPPRPPGGA